MSKERCDEPKDESHNSYVNFANRLYQNQFPINHKTSTCYLSNQVCKSNRTHRKKWKKKKLSFFNVKKQKNKNTTKSSKSSGVIELSDQVVSFRLNETEFMLIICGAYKAANFCEKHKYSYNRFAHPISKRVSRLWLDALRFFDSNL